LYYLALPRLQRLPALRLRLSAYTLAPLPYLLRQLFLRLLKECVLVLLPFPLKRPQRQALLRYFKAAQLLLSLHLLQRLPRA
jgi:hypothetical protein